MTLLELAILAAYFFVLSILAFYGWHRYVLVYWYKRYADHVPGPRPQLDPLPVVTIQLPIFNEMYVVDRLIDAVCRMDYPAELMEIQVLDDSTDETVDVAALAVRRWQNQGFNISYLHRTDRTGYKAGALEAGLNVAEGRYIAIFDADFVPPADFLRRALPQFGDPQVGMVQARWGHINADYSTLTTHPGDHARRPLRARARQPQPRRVLLQLQRHGRHLAPRRHRAGRRLAARHAHRGSRPQLPRAAQGLALRVHGRRHHPGRTAGGDEQLQVAAVPLGQGLGPDRPQAAAADSQRRPARSASRPRRSST